MRLLALLGPFTTELTDALSSVSFTSTNAIPVLLYTWSLKKKIPGFWAEAAHIGRYKELYP